MNITNVKLWGIFTALCITAAAQDKETVDFLYVQYADGVTLADHKLTMRGIQPETLYFSDRPDV